MMIILMGIALTILCICSVMELALLSVLLSRFLKYVPLKDKAPTNTEFSNRFSAEPATDASEDSETMKTARKRYEEELIAFQDLLNYNADVAYGINDAKSEE